MSLRRLLIHRCTTFTPGQKVGETEYGKPIYKDVVKTDVPCRSDLVKQFKSSDTYGTDVLTTNMLFLAPNETFTEQTRFSDIRDKENNVLLEGTHIVEDSKPAYGLKRLHHHEVSLKKASDSNG